MVRLLNRGVRIALDLSVISVAYWLAWLFRFEFRIPPVARGVALMTWPAILVVHYLTLTLFGVPRMAWRYVNMRDALRVVAACATSTATLVGLRLGHVLPETTNTIPLGVLAMDFVLVCTGVITIRSLWRVHNELLDRKRRGGTADRNDTLLIGAGEAGIMIARELVNRPDLGHRPIGFLDDDTRKADTRIFGLPVLGTSHDVEAVARRYRIKHALISIANVSGAEIRRLTELCRDAGLETKIIPALHELVGNTLNVSRLRDVAIEDLLGRAPVTLDEDIVGGSLRSRVVMVTGAGGSIGSELCRQICRFGPGRIVLVERFENALFEIHRELTAAFPGVPVDPRIADVTDVHRMTQVFEAANPEIVFHAAAHKHVPMMEWNPGEAAKNNVGGTRTLATLSDRFGVERFVLISTDKAVNPTSVMGTTKRIAEIYLQAFSQQSRTRFVTVRFGNVLGSAGSVIPIFKQQIAKGGPVLVTHPDMRRYFMTIPEASQLVLQAGAMGEGGEIFILDMGEPVRIVDLARDLITLSGMRPDADIAIKFTGMRPGEKLFEELSTAAELADKTRHPKVFIGRIAPQQWASVVTDVEALLDAAIGARTEDLRGALSRLVPEYASPGPARRSATPTPTPSAESILRLADDNDEDRDGQRARN